MITHRFDSFAELYRAAFAENDPEQKQLLLADVKTALDSWAEADRRHSGPLQRPSKPALRLDATSIHRVA